jgi:hypothetical protein
MQPCGYHCPWDVGLDTQKQVCFVHIIFGIHFISKKNSYMVPHDVIFNVTTSILH